MLAALAGLMLIATGATIARRNRPEPVGRHKLV